MGHFPIPCYRDFCPSPHPLPSLQISSRICEKKCLWADIIFALFSLPQFQTVNCLVLYFFPSKCSACVEFKTEGPIGSSTTSICPPFANEEDEKGLLDQVREAHVPTCSHADRHKAPPSLRAHNGLFARMILMLIPTTQQIVRENRRQIWIMGNKSKAISGKEIRTKSLSV